MGILKSELAEAQDIAERIRTERMLTKKLWTKDEMFVSCRGADLQQIKGPEIRINLTMINTSYEANQNSTANHFLPANLCHHFCARE
jgi:hypothetical protein